MLTLRKCCFVIVVGVGVEQWPVGKGLAQAAQSSLVAKAFHSKFPMQLYVTSTSYHGSMESFEIIPFLAARPFQSLSATLDSRHHLLSLEQ